jgi:hypothetical protein
MVWTKWLIQHVKLKLGKLKELLEEFEKEPLMIMHFHALSVIVIKRSNDEVDFTLHVNSNKNIPT